MATTISGTAGVTFPAGGLGNPAGAVVGTTDTQTLTNKTLSTGLVMGVSAITSGTSQVSTSGTSIDFTGIPSWVKRVTVLLNVVSTSGTSNYLVQIGAGSVTSTGYLSASITAQGGASSSAGATTTAGFVVADAVAAAYLYSGSIVIQNISGNVWVQTGLLTNTTAVRSSLSSGQVTLSGALDRVRITTVGGTDTFDAGSINILYE